MKLGIFFDQKNFHNSSSSKTYALKRCYKVKYTFFTVTFSPLSQQTKDLSTTSPQHFQTPPCIKAAFPAELRTPVLFVRLSTLICSGFLQCGASAGGPNEICVASGNEPF